jgi:hypothetical protein
MAGPWLRRAALTPAAGPAAAAAARALLPSFFAASSHPNHFSSSAREQRRGVAAATATAPIAIDAFLAPFKNHERTGVPAGAGTARGSDGFDLARMHRLLAALSNPHLVGEG